jgi:hypothetical protein
VTQTHDTLAAKNPNEQLKDSMLVYMNCLCTCSIVLGANDAMDECDKRAIGAMPLFTCIDQIWYPTLGIHVALKLTGGWVGQQNSFHFLLKLEQPRSRLEEANILFFKASKFAFWGKILSWSPNLKLAQY